MNKTSKNTHKCISLLTDCGGIKKLDFFPVIQNQRESCKESKIKEPTKVSKNRIHKFSNKDSDNPSRFACPKLVLSTKS